MHQWLFDAWGGQTTSTIEVGRERIKHIRREVQTPKNSRQTSVTRLGTEHLFIEHSSESYCATGSQPRTESSAPWIVHS
eukprot:1512938-Rhodomonas_salina.1